LLPGKTLQSLACKFMRRIRFTAHITDDAPTTTATIANFVYCEAKAVARRHAASDHRSAICPHYHAVIWPARRGEIQRAGADVRFKLSRAAHMRKAERLRVDGPTSNKNGQATSGPAVLVESGVHVDHQALPQTAFLPFWRYFLAGERGFQKSLTRCCALVPTQVPHVGSIGRRQFGPHRMVAAVDVQKLAGGHVQVLR
jgi:hypothetical protein